jgi:ribose 1,5-bisphosphate isomerase
MPSKSLKKVLRDIRSLRIQGSSRVRKAIVAALKQSVFESRAKTVMAFRNELKKNALELIMARPTEPEARTAVRIILKAASIETKRLQELKDTVVKATEKYEAERKRAMLEIAEFGSNIIEKGDIIFTHCHSHTVEGILTRARKKIDYVIATETRPLLQGRITAKNLGKLGIEVKLVVDSAAFAFMEEADKLFTGCDAVLADGSIVNKIGTAQIALSAWRYNVPYYVATSSHCFEPASYYGIPEKIEKRSPKEVWDKKVRGVTIRNPAFDITKADYVQAIVTEIGVFPPKMFALEMARQLELSKRKQEFMSLLKLMQK